MIDSDRLILSPDQQRVNYIADLSSNQSHISYIFISFQHIVLQWCNENYYNYGCGVVILWPCGNCEKVDHLCL